MNSNHDFRRQSALVGLCLVLVSGLAYAKEPDLATAVFTTDDTLAAHVQTPTAPESLTESAPLAPAATAPSPLAEMLFGADTTLRVADAVSRLGQAEPLLTPAVAPVAALQSDDSPLNRPIVALTLDSAADPKLTSQMANLSDEFAINDTSLERFGDWNAPQYEATLAPARYGCRTAAWAAPAVYSRPLYFEQPNLERYGHHVAVCEKDCLTQSALSAAHFFATVPVLPYKMGAEHPDECSYVLGHYRPGSCNPHQLQRPQWSLRGLAYEGLVVTGLVFLIP